MATLGAVFRGPPQAQLVWGPHGAGVAAPRVHSHKPWPRSGVFLTGGPGRAVGRPEVFLVLLALRWEVAVGFALTPSNKMPLRESDWWSFWWEWWGLVTFSSAEIANVH